MNTPNYGYGWQTGAGRIDRTLFDEGLRQHMLRVYNYMGIGLVLTGLVAYIVGTTPALYVPIFSTPLKWVVMLAPLAFVLFFSFRMQTISAAGAQGMFWAFCAVMGLSRPPSSWFSPEPASRSPSSSRLRCSALPASTVTRPSEISRSSALS